MGCNCGKKTTVSKAAITPALASEEQTGHATGQNEPPATNPYRSRAKNIRESLVVSDEEKARRLAICDGCPHFRPQTTRCGQCGCFLNIKAKLAMVSCPIGQW